MNRPTQRVIRQPGGIAVKKKPLLIIAAVLAGIILLLILLAPTLSQAIYGRSLAATIMAWQFHKDAYTTDEAFAAYLADKSAENARPYTLPEDAALTVPAEAVEFGGLPGYVLNGGGGTVIFYFTGGSYIDQPRSVQWAFADALAADTGAAVVVPIYPKLPDSDAAASYAAVTAFVEGYLAGTDADRVIFLGDSAGGGMALSLAMQLRDLNLPGPDRLILICPWVDVSMTNPDIPAYEAHDPALDSAMLAHLGAIWAGDRGVTDPVVSPLYGSFEGLCDVTLFTSTGELLYPDIMLLDAALTDAGVAHETVEETGIFHVWPLYAAFNLPESVEAYEVIVSAIG